MNGLRETLLKEVLRDAHRYVPGTGQSRPTNLGPPRSRRRRFLGAVRERGRDLTERAASAAGFTHAHYQPDRAAVALDRVLELSDGLEETYQRLGDEPSRRAMLDLLKLRVLGPYHARLAITPQRYRARQALAERELRLSADTFHLSDPWFSPLSLYRVPLGGSASLTLHSHSVSVASVFLLEQYQYALGPARIGARPGQVALDIGGGWGDTALWLAHRVGPAGKVYTFEFDPENLEVLKANLDLNPELAGRIEVVPMAAWERSGEHLLFTSAGAATTVLGDQQAPSGTTVQTISVDEFVAQAGLPSLGLIKLDVEGAEPRVLAGSQETLSRLRPALALAAYHRDDDLVVLPRLIAPAEDYRLYLRTASPLEDETVLFATAASNSR